jgi:hypothetical protein
LEILQEYRSERLLKVLTRSKRKLQMRELVTKHELKAVRRKVFNGRLHSMNGM